MYDLLFVFGVSKGMVLPGCDGADTRGRAPPWRCCSPVWSGLGRNINSNLDLHYPEISESYGHLFSPQNEKLTYLYMNHHSASALKVNLTQL